jgi:glycosyltransferase involved in cell wall biosynthesis
MTITRLSPSTDKATIPRGRLLVISYHFGLEGATGGFRWVSMSNGLIDRGWSVDVITAATAAPNVAVTSLHTVPSVTWPRKALQALLNVPRLLVRTLRSPFRSSTPRLNAPGSPSAPTPSSGAEPRMTSGKGTRLSQLSRALDHFAMMFEHWLWARRAARVGQLLSQRHKYAAVIVSSPPHEHHLAGLAVARAARIPFLADFRDPWVLALPDGFAGMSDSYRSVAGYIEKRIHTSASVVVHNTGRAREIISALPGVIASRRVSIPNGYDASTVTDLPNADYFEILFAGHLYPFMDIRVLLRAVRAFCRDSRVDRSRVRVIFLGTAPTHWGMPLTEILACYGLEDCSEVRPRVARAEAIRVQHRAAVQVVLDYPHPLSVPMKFYDYLQSGGNLLLFSRPGSALALAAGQVGCGIVEPEDEAGAHRVLLDAYDKWSAHGFPENNDPAGVHFRSERIDELDDLLSHVMGVTAQ